jgi:hypothetical protein
VKLGNGARMIAGIESLKEADKLLREINTRFAAISTQAQRREPTHNELLDVLRFVLGNVQGLVRPQPHSRVIGDCADDVVRVTDAWRQSAKRCGNARDAAEIAPTWAGVLL